MQTSTLKPIKDDLPMLIEATQEALCRFGNLQLMGISSDGMSQDLDTTLARWTNNTPLQRLDELA